MLDGEKVSGKANNSLKTNNTTPGNTSANNVFSSSDIEEEFDEGFPGPSTSNYNNGNGIDDLSLYHEDLDVKDHGNARQMFAEFRHLLDHDSVFHRIRGEVLGDLDKMAQEHQSIDNRQLSHRQRFEYLERLDDLLDTASDLNEAHIAVLRHVALQLSSHAPLEVMTNDFDLEQLFVVPEKQKENGFVEESPPKKIRKTRNIDERKTPSSVTVSKTQQNNETNHVKTGLSLQVIDIEPPKPKEVKEVVKESKSNGISTNNENNKSNGRPESSVESSTKSTENENPSSVSELAEIKVEDQPTSKNNNSSSKFDSDNSSNVDVKETRSSDKTKKIELKKPFKKPVNNKPNGVSKPVKTEKLANRRKSQRQNSKSSRTPEPEVKKPKRRAASAAINEPSNDTNTRQASQRRTTRNAQLNSELSNIDEQTYCLCDQISYGQMVCCDNLNCKIEWFHFDCVGLKVKPGKGQKWFCPGCRGGTSTTMKSAKR